ncbi:MAG: hypothetical protein P8Y70_19795 [Candidatus Lokiarchaeota archaeon]
MKNSILKCLEKCVSKVKNLDLPPINTEKNFSLKDIRRTIRYNCVDDCLKNEQDNIL